MPGEQAFLETIFERPEDDGPRSVYADWLEERGQTERAEFIRVQIQLPHAAPRSRERTALAKREKALLARHGAEWFPEFATGWTLNKNYFIRRGFVDAVEIRGEQFLQQMDAQFQRQPIHHLRLKNVTSEMARPIARSPRLTRLRRLEMYGAHIDADALREYLGSPHCVNLTSFSIGGNELGSDGLALLSQASSLSNLRELDVRHNKIGSEGIHALTINTGLPKLRSLNVCGNFHLANDVVDLLNSIHRQQLRHLDLWNTDLGDAGLRKLVACPSIGQLTSLNISNNGLTPRGIQSLLKCNFSSRLEELYLGFTPITVQLVEDFLSSPRFPRLRLLSLHQCGIDVDQQRALKRRYKTRVSFQYPTKAWP